MLQAKKWIWNQDIGTILFAGLRRLWLALGLITSKAEQEKVDDKGIYPEIIFFVKLSDIFFLLLLFYLQKRQISL